MKKILTVGYINGKFSSATYYHIGPIASGYIKIHDYNEALYLMSSLRRNKAKKTMKQFRSDVFEHFQYDSIEYCYSE